MYHCFEHVSMAPQKRRRLIADSIQFVSWLLVSNHDTKGLTNYPSLSWLSRVGKPAPNGRTPPKAVNEPPLGSDVSYWQALERKLVGDEWGGQKSCSQWTAEQLCHIGNKYAILWHFWACLVSFDCWSQFWTNTSALVNFVSFLLTVLKWCNWSS